MRESTSVATGAFLAEIPIQVNSLYWDRVSVPPLAEPSSVPKTLLVSIPVIGQCKLLKLRIGPKYVRELEGTISHETNPAVLGLFATKLGFTSAAVDQFRASSYPLVLATIVPPGSPETEEDEEEERRPAGKVSSAKPELQPPRIFTTFAQNMAVRIIVKGDKKTYTLPGTGEVLEVLKAKKGVLRSMKEAASPQATQEDPTLGKKGLWPVHGFVVNEAALKLWPKLQIGSRKQNSNTIPVAFYDGVQVTQPIMLPENAA